MLKEIHEQEAVAETLAGRGDSVDLGQIGISDEFASVRRIVIVACGTSYHAGLVGTLRDRMVGARARGDGHRVRVPLPQPGARGATW